MFSRNQRAQNPLTWTNLMSTNNSVILSWCWSSTFSFYIHRKDVEELIFLFSNSLIDWVTDQSVSASAEHPPFTNSPLIFAKSLLHETTDQLTDWLTWNCTRWCRLLYMKSSFPKRDKRQIEKKWVRHAILLCTEPIHCSINVSCQIAIFPCLKCTARCSSFPNRYKRRTWF